MPIPTYTLGYPPDGASLGQTKVTMRNNLDGTFETLGVDHINNNGQPGNQPAGYHNVIHVVPQGMNPGTVSRIGQLFTKTFNSFSTDEALFWETGNGLIQQLTVNFTPLAASTGYSFIAGGVILQWGTTGASSTTVPVTFPIVFPNALFNVQVTRLHNSSSPGSTFSYWVNSDNYNASGFQIINNDGHTWQYQWFAIGN